MNNCIERRRKLAGMTREDLCIALFNDGNKISLSTLHRYENNKSQPKLPEARAIAKVLNCKIDELF